jgi:CDP-glucose 4,6-dehydratase
MGRREAAVEGVAVSSSFWVDRPVLVTGGTGLVGSWLVRRLIEARAEVTCLIRDWVPESELVRARLIERVNVARGDVRDQGLLERVLGENEVATVIHLAAQTIVTVANRNPVSTFETNVAGTWALLEACRRSPTVKEIVVASSDKAYGDQETLPYTEETPLRGTHPYDVSKSCADLIAYAYANTYDLPVVVTRCGNFYGGGDLNWNRIVPGTIRAVLRGQRPVIRSDGRYVRDYFYVEDGAIAYMLLAEKLALRTARPGDAFNFSTDQPLDVVTLVDRILRAMDSTFEPEILNQASNEIARQWLSSNRARTVLDWQPSFSLDEGLARTIDWYRRFFGASS